uniref:BET1-like protein isoform X1 n=1 Tax=Callithrix jacchus TaxID=9483 RepID=UPI0023DD0E80|nr:BET1-like protein isoform X1 [Callithrix jacchus]
MKGTSVPRSCDRRFPTRSPQPEVSEFKAEGAGAYRGVVAAEAGPEVLPLDCATSEAAVAASVSALKSRGRHHGGLGSESWCCGRDTRPGEQANDRQPGLQSHQAQIACPGHRQGRRGSEPVPGWHGSVKRFSAMARSGRDNRKLLCGMAMGLIVVFFILSYFLSRART